MSNMISGTVMLTYNASHLSSNKEIVHPKMTFFFLWNSKAELLNNLDIRLIRKIL